MSNEATKSGGQGMPQSPQQTQPPQQQRRSPGKAQRKIRNFMLQPLLQVKLGLYSILLSVLFAGALAGVIYYNFANLTRSIILLTDAEDEVREMVMDYWRGAQMWVYLCFIIYLLATVLVSVLYTHKLVGPTFAFRRHIRSIAEGRYNARTYLRKGDAFAEVADELNRLSEVMERTKGAPHAQNAPQSVQTKQP